MKNVTWQQAIILVVCVAAPVVAYKFLGSPEAAGASMLAGMVLNFLIGRSDPPAPPASGGGNVAGGVSNVRLITLAGSAFCLGLLGCSGGLANLDDPELAQAAAKLSECRAEARAAAKAGASSEVAYAGYEACKKSAGL